MLNIPKRIEALRKLMKEKELDACIIPSSDPHLSEYPANHWKCREWISGFNGSAGTIVITPDKAGLWTDSRYFIQAGQQLANSNIELFREKLQGTLAINDWLAKELSSNSNIGIDGDVFSFQEATALIHFFTGKSINTHTDFKPFDIIWKDRPPVPENKIFVLSENFSGSDIEQKAEQILEASKRFGANTVIITSLDTIAWLFNIRGNDVKFNPVAVSYAIITEKENILFINVKKLTKEAIDYLQHENVTLADYGKAIDYLKKLTPDKAVLINQNKISYSFVEAIPVECSIVNTEIHPADLLKSIKNKTEIAGFHHAMVRDGVALCRFLIWFEKTLTESIPVTELDISRKLREYRSRQEFYFGESFETIAGYAAHGAIVHYGATEESNAEIKPEGFLLIDSGAQYFDATTDITRTIALGNVSNEMKRDYSLVLKGHIALACARFPEGTKGIQLDILARKPLWENGLNYLHGTGHGVGHFLNVHEGPQSIRMDYNPAAIEEGMILSNEPGIYRPKEYGIRIENIILTIKDKTTLFGNFFCFETLTLCPIDKSPVEKSLLDKDEIEWFNAYHRKVFESLSPQLTEEEITWLREKTKEL